MELANGTEDGLKYRVYYSDPNWIAELTTPDGAVITESWHANWEPIFGPDIADVAQCEAVLENLISAYRKASPPSV